MYCPYKFNESTIDSLGGMMPGKRAECEREKCAKWIPDPSNILKGDCSDVAAAKGLAALASLAKVFGK